MLSKAQKNWMIAIGIVSLVLGLIVALPFRSIPGLNNGENIFVVVLSCRNYILFHYFFLIDDAKITKKYYLCKQIRKK